MNQTTCLPNALLDHLLTTKLTEREQKAFFLIARYTIGQGEDVNKIHLKNFEKFANIPANKVLEVVNRLESRQIIFRDKNLYQINMDFAQWKTTPFEGTFSKTTPKEGTLKTTPKEGTFSKTTPKEGIAKRLSPKKGDTIVNVIKSSPTKVVQLFPDQNKNGKFSSQKSTTKKYLSTDDILSTYPGIPVQVAKDFLTMRAEKKSRLTQTAWNRLCAQIQRSHLSATEVLELCCERGWRSFNANWAVEDSNHSKHYQSNLRAAEEFLSQFED